MEPTQTVCFSHEPDNVEHIAGLEDLLLETHMVVMKNETRLWMLKSLLDRNLATNDIYSFVSGQAFLRDNDSTPDPDMTRIAMKAKIRDVKKSIRIHHRQRRLHEEDLFRGLSYKSRTFRRKIKKIRKTTNNERKLLKEKYEKKIEHLKGKQSNLENGETVCEAGASPTVVPNRLEAYQTLSIFGGPSDLPRPEKPVGPFICDQTISLTENELKILQRDPKFSVRSQTSKQKFTTEIERMNSKHRYNKGNKKQALSTPRVEDDPKQDHDRIEKLYETFYDYKDKYIYNPLNTTINFNLRRASDYKLNKYICLPKPLPDEEEFECEYRRREYLKGFDEYDKNTQNYKGSSRGKRNRSSNLSQKEILGLKSLKERIKQGDLQITQTDKSGRFAVMYKKQYLDSGYQHTSKDQEIGWGEVQYLQGQVNHHVWWLTKILGYSAKKDHDRMSKNLQNNTLEIPEMILLLKDHKAWDPLSGLPPPSRPVVSGSKGINTHLSELVAEITEPVAKEILGGEVCSTEESLSKIEYINGLIENDQILSEFNVLEQLSQNLHSCHNFAAHEVQLNNCFLNREQKVSGNNMSNDPSLNISDYWTDDECGNADILDSDDKKDELATILTLEELIKTSGRKEFRILNENVEGEQNAYEPEEESDDIKPMSDDESYLRNFPEGDIRSFFRPFTTLDGRASTDELRIKWLEGLEFKQRRSADNRKKFNESISDLSTAGMNWSKRNKIMYESTLNKKHAPESIQDFTAKPMMIGSDVSALYPSLDIVATAELAQDAVIKSKVKFEGVHFGWLAVYLYLIIGTSGMLTAGLGDAIPRRIENKSDPKSLASKTNKNIYNWICNDDLTEELKRKMIGMMIKISTLVLMETTIYTFGGKIYKQKSGVGIGLRGSASLAKLVMAVWDGKWAKVMLSWGLKVQTYFRYIDDLRLYLFPLKKGWIWTCEGWKFDETCDQRTAMRRTCDELAKSMNNVFEFLEFTMECEEDFESGWLPTLDMQTKVRDDGVILFKFFRKPMANNIAIQFGSALSSNTIFSSLRQETVRRLLHTSLRVDWDTRLQVLEEYIKTLVNSGHHFPYIKAVVLQGISKYQFMVERANLDSQDTKYMPLYREQSFRRNERILIKLVDKMVWHKDEDLGDPFRKGWKTRINRKRWKDKMGNQGRNTIKAPDTTSTIFIPQSEGSNSFKNIVETERKVSQKVNWSVKVIEQPGIPLLHSFTSKFPIEKGCPRGDRCCLCENNGIGCTMKSVVYSAVCKLCCPEGGTVNENVKFNATYIGETSRPWRERIIEHKENASKWKPCSFILEHWMRVHSTDTQMPEFRFKIVESYKDPLRRQLSEALHILDTGGLNKRMEFNANFICRLESKKTPTEMENEARVLMSSKKLYSVHMSDFINVMSAVLNCRQNDVSNQMYVSRSKRILADPPLGRIFKQARMEASTPRFRGHRGYDLDTSCSPINKSSSSSEMNENSCDQPDLSTGKGSTKLSRELDTMALSRREKINSSQESRDFALLTRNWTFAAADAGVGRRSSSLPPYINRIRLNDNTFFKFNPNRVQEIISNTPDMKKASSVGDISLSPWNDLEVFKQLKEEN